METKSRQKPRIAIYGTGQFGQYITRLAVQKGWPIVAAFNRAGNKVGQDIGRLSGLDKDLGVIVQDCDLANYDEVEADVGIVNMTDRLKTNMPAYRRLMNAGINVICHGVESYYPQGADEVLAREINELGLKNNVTFTGTGIWDYSRIWAGMLIAGPCTEINSLYHKGLTDAEGIGKALMLITGVGMSVEEFDEKIAKVPGRIGGLYKLVPHHVMDALGYTVTKVTERREPVLYDKPIYSRILERNIEPGVCAGMRIVIDVETKEGASAKGEFELRILHENEPETMMWAIDGKPSSRITIERGNQGLSTAACLFNRIPDVIAAPPGIQLVSKLGLLRHTALQ